MQTERSLNADGKEKVYIGTHTLSIYYTNILKNENYIFNFFMKRLLFPRQIQIWQAVRQRRT